MRFPTARRAGPAQPAEGASADRPGGASASSGAPIRATSLGAGEAGWSFVRDCSTDPSLEEQDERSEDRDIEAELGQRRIAEEALKADQVQHRSKQEDEDQG